MNRIWQRISLGRDFSVVSIADDIIRGGRFQRQGKVWQLKAYEEEIVAEEAPGDALVAVMRKVGMADFCAVTGKMPGMLFFRFISTDLPVSAQRGAVEFELPRRLLKLPEAYQLQFVADDIKNDDDTVGVNVAVFPEAAIKTVADKLTGAGRTADEFISPYMAVSPLLPAIYLPEIEPDFYFTDGKWMPCPENSGELRDIVENAESVIQDAFALPDDGCFSIRKYMPVLLCAYLISQGTVHKSLNALKVLPEKVRPVRFRKHLIISALLGLVLLGEIGWYFSRTYGSDISEYRSLTKEARRLKSQTQEMRNASKRGSKELKEMSRVVDMNVGDFDAIREFGLISEILPSNVMVSSMRWSDSSIDMVLQCENDKLDISALFLPLRRWRIAQLQQRQAGDSAVATINLKLAPLNAPDKNKKEAKR